MGYDMTISPNYKASQWKNIEMTIDSPEEDWEDGIAIFRDRIEGRFFQYIDKIKSGGFSGFVVMALSCLLLETLQQFREGVDQTPQGMSGEYFTKFLTETFFADHFDRYNSNMFYKQIRCGILHHAEVEKSSLIRADDSPLVSYTDNRKGLIINRRKFYDKLKEAFDAYVTSVHDPANETIRKNFIRKMDYICRVTSQE